ncbi:polysaccharide biosynthesis/export family protein [Devosia sp.]|uniref:polysaccharide biosynthesis/export family protein n=1 Tax=Devosia sp. TaxID=1871048 RepID=UPI001AD1DD89|nr:polysaccharide biosynthesis/export family protein [Devosia sp.]MBN9333224.1 polysaccharide biosynthesis/export family protein [Devosia sp.]
MRIVTGFFRNSRHLALVALLLGSTFMATPAQAEPLPLAPLTKLRLTVVQFVASTGDYKRWDALGGDMDVGPDGTLTVPTLGSIDVVGMSADQLGAEIGKRLQAKLGLLDAPDATVQVLAYPPIYVVGSVSSPGQYAFQPGMTVVQAMALAGGERNAEMTSGLSQTIKLQADLDSFSADILRSRARLARLQAEYGKAKEITFPSTLSASDPLVAEIMGQEKMIFQAHVNELDRQQTSLIQLADLYNAEIDALAQKGAALDEQIALAQQQVDSMIGLVNSGSATVSRLNEVQRALSDLRSERLDVVVATMTAKQNLNSSQRDLARIQDEQQSNTAGLLQQEQAGLDKLVLNQNATARMLGQSLEADHSITLARAARTSLVYAILREKDGKATSVNATEGSTLLPGDLVRVTMQVQLPTADGDVPVAANSP